MTFVEVPNQSPPETTYAPRIARRGGVRKWVLLLLGAVAVAAALSQVVPPLLVKQKESANRRTAGLELRRARVEDHEIAYLEGGRGETVVLLHGFGADKDNWTLSARYLTPSYHVIAPDLPGFGDSSYVEGASYRLEEQARRLERLVQVLGLTRFHLAGNSMGGQIAGHYAAAHPERLLSLALVDCTGVRSPVLSDMAQRIRRGEPPPLVVSSVKDFDRRMGFLFVQEPEIPGFIKRVIVSRTHAAAPHHETILQQITPEMEALERDLPRITARTLVLWGDRDRMRDISSVEVLKRALPTATVVIMSNCGHVPMSERPQEFGDHYLRFLDAEARAGGDSPDGSVQRDR